LSDLIARALGKDRQERPANATAMRDELLATATAQAAGVSKPAPISADKPKAVKLSTTPPSRKGAWLAVAVAAFAAAGLAAWQLRPGPGVSLPVKAPIAAVTPTPAAPTAAPAASPEQVAKYKSYMAEGKEAYDQQDFEKALDKFSRAHLADPSQADPYYRMGLVYKIQGDKPNAAKYWQYYVDFFPRPPNAAAVSKAIAGLTQ
jgi:tetratricopeptide (TPR) repeat protein